MNILHGMGIWLLDDGGMMLWSLIVGTIGFAAGALASKLTRRARMPSQGPE